MVDLQKHHHAHSLCFWCIGLSLYLGHGVIICLCHGLGLIFSIGPGHCFCVSHGHDLGLNMFIGHSLGVIMGTVSINHSVLVSTPDESWSLCWYMCLFQSWSCCVV